MKNMQRYNTYQLINPKKILLITFLILTIINLSGQQKDSLIYADEKHFTNIKRLTFNGDNAEAYWSYNDRHIIFQRKNEKENIMCDRMFIGTIPQSNKDSFAYKQLSSGKGRTTCGYFLKDGKHVLYASNIFRRR